MNSLASVKFAQHTMGTSQVMRVHGTGEVSYDLHDGLGDGRSMLKHLFQRVSDKA
ncbi:MAG: hypothetical protein HOE62_05385 [Alphaproteobacteria bacterium]|nr:hypothetical protein [Alphaproteobacteria bacterium]MBT4017361.1 hypothetical protein [Alphaproteobacteria bacterium]MBT4965874.1 hypothetical protein [Alphaproteobacteria bacterium]MBT5158787.1 hypothetical protein [Alphaproteobacteria bacterium]MBT6387365.1 hypothetical protein [Alphaproteobacteria bacterium]